MSELWGARFSEPIDETMRRFSTSLPIDRRLVREDIEGSRAHAAGLVTVGVLDEPR
jgi:argininosuccinate lyase